jgi:cation transport ATPase
VRLEPSVRFWTYAIFATLALTGLIWLCADVLKDPEGEIWQMVAADMLMLHGMTAMIALVLIGAMIPLHIQRSWRAGKNRVSGAVMIGVNAVLVATAWGLYYAGSDLLRTFVADVHIAVGLALPALVIAHVVLGRRAKMRAEKHVEAPARRDFTPSAPTEAGAVFQAVTFSKDRGSR